MIKLLTIAELERRTDAKLAALHHELAGALASSAGTAGRARGSLENIARM